MHYGNINIITLENFLPQRAQRLFTKEHEVINGKRLKCVENPFVSLVLYLVSFVLRNDGSEFYKNSYIVAR